MATNGIDNTYGAILVGLVVAAVIYGITVLQTFLYYKHYPRDSVVLKLLVFILWILDTCHLIFCTMALYWYLISNFSDAAVLSRTTWSMNIQTDFNGLIGLIVEWFFAWRVWIVSKNMFLTCVILVLAVVHFAFGIVFTVYNFIYDSPAESRERLTWVTATGLGSAAMCDFLIAVSLCYYLFKSRTGFSRTDSLISTLMIYSLTTGLLTSITAFICVVTYAVLPTEFIWLAFFWVLGKLHVNSLLATLNCRDSLRKKASSNRELSFHRMDPVGTLQPQVHKGSVSSPRFVVTSEPRSDLEISLPSKTGTDHCSTLSGDQKMNQSDDLT